MDLLLAVFAVLLVVGGIVAIIRRDWVLGSVLVVLGLLVGPGGISLLS